MRKKIRLILGEHWAGGKWPVGWTEQPRVQVKSGAAGGPGLGLEANAELIQGQMALAFDAFPRRPRVFLF